MALTDLIRFIGSPAIYAVHLTFRLVKLIIKENYVRSVRNFFRIATFRYLLTTTKALIRIRRYKNENVTVVKEFYRILKELPNKTCFLFEDQVWNISHVEDYSNRICSLFSSLADKDEVVALLLPNRPEYGCIWLGNAKAGIITALINTNLRMKPLLHSINVSKPKAIIYSNQYDQALTEILSEIEGNPKLYSFEGGSSVSNSENLHEVLKSVDPDIKLSRELNLTDVVLYIYTSGTTGLPKPAKITHSKLLALALSAELTMGVREDDIIYSPLPMYHGSSTAATVSVFVRGLSSVLRTKFSASSYISDCIKYKATVGQYIGEMLRYISCSEEQQNDRHHNLRQLVGNGVRSEVWRKFVKRFNGPKIVEFYGSTEGNFLISNNRNVVGKCGYLPLGLPYWHLLGPSIVKVNEETGQPIRNKDGLCILAEPGERGLLIGYCPAGNEMRKFYGYVKKQDTDSKIILDVFKNGDSAFSSGDLVMMDEEGGVSFVDRFGDTFRWKGENVSTAEVEAILNECPNVEDSAVYGVQVGNLEGKAGMASVIMKSLDIESLNRYLDLNLPSYACPLFIRLVDSLQYTSTFKVIKTNLKKQSFDLKQIVDPLFVRLSGRYIPFTVDIYQQIIDAKLKL